MYDLENKKPREVVIVRWSGSNQPIYRFYDELALSDHMRTFPTPKQVQDWKEWREHGKRRQCPCGNIPHNIDCPGEDQPT